MVKTPPPPRDQILDIAAAAFAEAGFAGARIDDIARRAGVNKAMLYYYVGDKQELYLAVIRAVLAHARTALAGVLEREADAPSRLRAVVREIASLAERHPHFPPIIIREIASGGHNLPDDLVADLGALFQRVASLYREGAAEGSLREVDPLVAHMVTVAGTLLLVGSGPLRERIRAVAGGRAAKQEDAAALASAVADLLLDGVRARPDSSGRTR